MADDRHLPKAPGLSPDIQLVLLGGLWDGKSGTGFTRLIVSRTCSIEHCWSEGRIEWVSDEGGQVAATTALPEIAYGRWTEGGRVRFLRGVAYFDVFVRPSHYDGPTRTLRIRAGTLGEYEARLLSPRRPKSVPESAVFIDHPLSHMSFWVECRKSSTVGQYTCQKYKYPEGKAGHPQAFALCKPDSPVATQVVRCAATASSPIGLFKIVSGFEDILMLEGGLALQPLPIQATPTAQ